MNTNRTTKALQSKTWSSVRPKVNKNRWDFHPKKSRGQIADLSPVIKPTTFGSKVYRLGPYSGTLDELKEFAAMKGLMYLQNGAVTYKVA